MLTKFLRTGALAFGLALFSAACSAQLTDVPPEQSTAAQQSNTPGMPIQEKSSCSAEGFKFQNKQIYFNTDNPKFSQRIFLIHNRANYTVIVNHMNMANQGASMGAGWSSKIEGGKYSALAMNEKNFPLACLGYSPPTFGLVDCQSVLEVCAYPQQNTTIGNFWVAENLPLEKIKQALLQRFRIAS